jgi:hypothetical protein
MRVRTTALILALAVVASASAVADSTPGWIHEYPPTVGDAAQIDKLITYMKGKPGVWFATLEQIAEAVKSGGAR